MLAGWLPRGFVSTDPISGLVESFVDDDWPDHPNYWAVAADYATGKRVAFGREDAPPRAVGEAVAASCAIPGFYHPVKIAGRRYVDGGDLLELEPRPARRPGPGPRRLPEPDVVARAGDGRLARRPRRAASCGPLPGGALGREARKLRGEGTERR